jgi:hypothetical protein
MYSVAVSQILALDPLAVHSAFICPISSQLLIRLSVSIAMKVGLYLLVVRDLDFVGRKRARGLAGAAIEDVAIGLVWF